MARSGAGVAPAPESTVRPRVFPAAFSLHNLLSVDPVTSRLSRLVIREDEVPYRSEVRALSPPSPLRSLLLRRQVIEGS